jgi:septal ring factor EnvC (AmiA/AmiB activator)
LIDRNAFDPIDGIQLLRRIMAHAATAPSNLNLHATLLHIASRETLKIFECDMVCLFIKDPVRENVLLRYTVKSPLPEEVRTSETTCVAADVIKSGKIARINVVANNAQFNPLVDCCTGVIVKRMMSLPIYDADTNRVFGCINIVNKSKNDLFSETDEMFGLLFADQASLLVTACTRYDGMSSYATLLQHLLEASTAVFSVIPDPDSLVSNRPLQPEQVLSMLETVSREVLKCPTTRAFLVSDFAGLPPGELVLVDHAAKSKALSIETFITMPLHSGIAGHVIATGQMYKLENDKFDPYINPLVDIDPLDLPMITVPIVDLHGTVVGCLQLVVGPRSPKLRESEDIKSQQGLLFVDAAQWLTHQIAAPVQYLIKFIGNTVNRPVSTPSNFVSRGPKPDFFMTGLEGMMLNGGGPPSHFRPLSTATSPTADFVAVPMFGMESAKTHSSQQSRVKFHDDSAERGALQTENESLQHDLAESRNEVSDLLLKLGDAEAAASLAQTARSELQQVIAKLEGDLDALNKALHAKSANDGAVAALERALAATSAAEAETEQVRAEIQTLHATHEAADAELLESREQIASMQRQIENLEAYAATHHRSDEEGEAADGVNAAATANDDVEERIRVACDAAREAVTAEWKESYESLEQSYNSFKSCSEAQQSENETLTASNSALQNELYALRSEVESQKKADGDEIVALKEKVAQLTATVAQRDSVQAILQAQVARMAGENLKEINQVVASVTAGTAAGAKAETNEAPKAGAPAPTAAAPGSTISAPPGRVMSQPPTPPSGSRQPSGRRHSRPPSGRRPTSGGAGVAAPPAVSTGDVTADLAAMGWTQHVDEYQRTYYYHDATGQSSWANPSVGEVRRGEWVQTYDESGSMYWVHQVTGESAWDVTEGGEPVESTGAEMDEDDGSPGPMGGGGGIYDTVNSQYSATAGDYTIEL